MKIEDMIIEAELLALSMGVTHDEAMDIIVSIGKIADERTDQYKSMAKEYFELYKNAEESNQYLQSENNMMFGEMEQMKEEYNFYKATTFIYVAATIIGVLYLCL